jgi:hypothetical protein
VLIDTGVLPLPCAAICQREVLFCTAEQKYIKPNIIKTNVTITYFSVASLRPHLLNNFMILKIPLATIGKSEFDCQPPAKRPSRNDFGFGYPSRSAVAASFVSA